MLDPTSGFLVGIGFAGLYLGYRLILTVIEWASRLVVELIRIHALLEAEHERRQNLLRRRYEATVTEEPESGAEGGTVTDGAAAVSEYDQVDFRITTVRPNDESDRTL